ncbi:MAG: hypothetical protein HYY85_00825 [Deltaproteobacteria bacterium]|nr:hypothetical protein [Deltaproteobacteria bacterium]
MKQNKDKTIKDLAVKLTISENVARKTYDFDIENLSNDGTLNMKGLEVIAQAAVDLKIVPRAPKVSEIIDTRFLPVRVP